MWFTDRQRLTQTREEDNMIDSIKEVLEHYGYWAHGGDVDRVAKEWVEEGFTDKQVELWLEADVCWACQAREHVNKGFTPYNWKTQDD